MLENLRGRASLLLPDHLGNRIDLATLAWIGRRMLRLGIGPHAREHGVEREGDEQRHENREGDGYAELEKDLADISEVELRPRMEGNQLFTIFQPKRHKKPEGSKQTLDGSNQDSGTIAH